MKRVAAFISALLILTTAVPGFSKDKNKGPVGVWWERVPWEADLDPWPDGDGLPEQYWITQMSVYSSDGTLSGRTSGEDSGLFGTWVATGKHTVATKSVAFGKTLVDGESVFSVRMGEAEATFDAEFETFTARLIRVETWLCPRAPWGLPWDTQCPNPLTTTEEPDFVVTEADNVVIYGWRVPGPTVP